MKTPTYGWRLVQRHENGSTTTLGRWKWGKGGEPALTAKLRYLKAGMQGLVVQLYDYDKGAWFWKDAGAMNQIGPGTYRIRRYCKHRKVWETESWRPTLDYAEEERKRVYLLCDKVRIQVYRAGKWRNV